MLIKEKNEEKVVIEPCTLKELIEMGIASEVWAEAVASNIVDLQSLQFVPQNFNEDTLPVVTDLYVGTILNNPIFSEDDLSGGIHSIEFILPEEFIPYSLCLNVELPVFAREDYQYFAKVNRDNVLILSLVDDCLGHESYCFRLTVVEN